MYKEINGEKVELTQEEEAQINRNLTLRMIVMLEEKITPRRIREALTTGNNDFINDIEKQIDELRTKL